MTSAVPSVRLLGVALAALLVLSACGSDDPSVDAIGSSEESAVAPVSEDASTSVDLAAFFDGALTEEAVTTDCTLADGTETSCYQLTVAGFPATRDTIGPWCPETTSDDASDAGI